VLLAPVPQQAVPAQQRVLQAIWPAPQTQVPAVHTWPAPQAWPQAPQFALSVATFLQLAPQQSWPAVQALPAPEHAPQCASSVCRSKQPADPQLVRFALVQAQSPAGQAVFPGSVQLTPQVPQFCGSKRLVQAGCDDTALVHSTGSGAKQPQAPPSHCEPAKVQAVVQSPQWARSLVVLTQVPPHSVAVEPPAQAHTPPEHDASASATPGPRQECPHAPQSCLSAWRSTQAPQQVCPAPQVTPQPPQFAGSLLVSTHLPPHLMLGK
jgi:hypothetical protein